MPIKAKLTVVSGPSDQLGRVIDFRTQNIRLGRSKDCDVVLNDQGISRIHAEIVWDGDIPFLIHRSQTNPTIVNGVPVPERVRLAGGEEIQLAEGVVLKFHLEVEATSSELPSPIVVSSHETTTPHHARPISRDDAANPKSVHLAIIGAGPAGIAAAVRAARRGIEHTLYERSRLADTIEKYPKGKFVMAEPPQLPLQGDIGFTFREGKREEVLGWWSTAIREAGVKVALGCEVLSIKGAKGEFELHARDETGDRIFAATHVIIAVGEQSDLKKFTNPGSDQTWVLYQLDDPDEFQDKRILVVGVGDAGVENALALSESGNDVTVVNRREEIDKARPRNKSRLESKIKSGEIGYLTNLELERFDTDGAVFRTKDKNAEVKLECDYAIGRLGANPPRKFLESIGITFPSSDEKATPDVSERYESNRPGIYLVGAVAGYPLIKNCLNQGFEVVEHILGFNVEPADEAVIADRLREVQKSVSAMMQWVQGSVPTLAPLTSVQMRSLLFDSSVRIVKPGSVIYSRADFENTFFAILEGEIELEYPDNSHSRTPEGEQLEHPVKRIKRRAGQFFGEDGLISGRRRGETVTAKTKAILLEIPRNTMARLARSVVDVKRAIDAAYVDFALKNMFQSLSEERRELLAAGSRTLVHRAGKAIFSEGDEPDGLHLIRRGTVEVYKKYGGVEEQINTLRAGSTLGESAVLRQGTQRAATARASVDCETVLLPLDLMRDCVENEPEVRGYLEQKAKDLVIADARRGHGRGTLLWLQQKGGKEATDLLVIDETLCVRCDNCEKACAETHGGVSRLQREAGATYMSSTGSALHLPIACQHCENPKCMTDCPPDSLHRDRNGEVWIDYETCIGCGNCEAYCPYGVIAMAEVDNDPGPGLLMRLLYPLRAILKKGSTPSEMPEKEYVKKAVKCDLCRDLPAKRGGAPRAACVASCPTGAIVRVDPGKFVDEIYERQG